MPVAVFGRLITIFFSLIIIALIYYLTLYEHSRIAAITASFMYASFPFFVYYSRVVLPETTALACAFIAIFLAHLWAHHNGKRAVVYIALSAASAALALLVKPMVIFYLLPVGYLFFVKYRFNFVKHVSPYLYVACALVPLILWRIWIAKYPEGIPYYEWLITSVNTFEGQKNIFFRPAFFRWIFYERIALLILGGYALILPLLGIIEKSRKSLLLPIIALAALAYLFVFQGGNVQHDYYQTIILPAIAILSGIGAARLLHKNENDRHIVLNVVLVIFILGFSWLMSYYRVKDYYNYSEDLVNIAEIINTLTPRNALVVTDRDGDTTLLYLAHRKGMPAVTEDLHKLRDEHGMQYFYTDKPAVAQAVKKEFPAVFENDHVFIFKL